MIKFVKIKRDATGLCAVCPKHKTADVLNELVMVGSCYCELECSNCIKKTKKYVICRGK